MVYILNIHTATETAIVNLMEDEKILATLTNTETKEHAAFLHIAVKELLQLHGIDLKDLAAIGVTSGPGSYTGIRIGLATVKGLCYALKIPLIIYNSLELMAISAVNFAKDANAFYSPMIDARRLEVYSAVYNYNVEEIITPSAVILSETLFAEIPACHKIFFSGNGSNKFQKISKYTNAVFLTHEITTESFAKIAWKKYAKNDFANVPYAQPLYIK